MAPLHKLSPAEAYEAGRRIGRGMLPSANVPPRLAMLGGVQDGPGASAGAPSGDLAAGIVYAKTNGAALINAVRVVFGFFQALFSRAPRR